MPTLTTILLFALIATTFVVVPGPSNLSVLSRGVGDGARMAIFGAAGCATGAALYVVATAAGLAAVIASSRPVFAALHYAGALYLLVLGVRVARFPPSLGQGADAARTTATVAYRQGALIEISNPKVALFFLALFPQFIHPGRGPAWSQIAVLGAVFVAIGFLSDSTYALASGAIGAWLRERPRLARSTPKLISALYFALGAWVLSSGADTHQAHP